MQKIISIFLLGFCIFLLAQPLKRTLKEQENRFLTPDPSVTIQPATQVRLTGAQLGSKVAASTPSALYAKAYCVDGYGFRKAASLEE